jgi:hypothetical protein
MSFTILASNIQYLTLPCSPCTHIFTSSQPANHFPLEKLICVIDRRYIEICAGDCCFRAWIVRHGRCILPIVISFYFGRRQRGLTNENAIG